MKICNECGKTFEDDAVAVWNERHGFSEPPYESWTGCPFCYGGYDEAVQCEQCGKYHYEKDIYNGWCLDCLRDEIDCETTLDFLLGNEYFYQFMFESVFGIAAPAETSEKLTSLLITEFIASYATIEAVVAKFILDDDGNNGREVFAEWLNLRVKGRSVIC